jgi:DNA-directed RNA polymerase specialized sigma24 family protein
MSSSEEPNSPSQQDGSGSGPENLNDLRNAIRAFVLSQVRNPALADDLTQETLLRLHKRLHTLRNPERLHAWVFHSWILAAAVASTVFLPRGRPVRGEA